MAAYRRCPVHVCRNILQRGIAFAGWDIDPLGRPGESESVPERYAAGLPSRTRNGIRLENFSHGYEPPNVGIIRPVDRVLAAAAHKVQFGQPRFGQIGQMVGHLDLLGRQGWLASSAGQQFGLGQFLEGEHGPGSNNRAGEKD